MIKRLLLAVLVLGVAGACSYRETKTVQAQPAAVDAPPATSTTTSTKIGF